MHPEVAGNEDSNSGRRRPLSRSQVAWRYAVLRWGLPFAILMSALDVVWDYGFPPKYVNVTYLISEMVFSFILLLGICYVIGLLLWKEIKRARNLP